MARGSLIRVEAAPPPPDFFGNDPVKGDLEPVTVTWFLLNTTGNREFLARLERGQIQIEETSLLFGGGPVGQAFAERRGQGKGPRNAGPCPK